MAMFGGLVFLGQYFQIGRGYTPTEAGLLTIPMMAGSRTSARPARRWRSAGVPASAGDEGTSSLNLAELPAAVQHIVRAAYGDATGHIFLISAGIAVIGVLAALPLKPITLRTTVDLDRPGSAEQPVRVGAAAAD
jgi:hypothetical protein